MERTDAIKLLAIDDKPDNLTTLSAVVRDVIPQTRVLTATNGPAGIELAVAEDPDVILLDILMPGMDGFEVCRRLKADDRINDIPVVFLTALKTNAASRVKALEVGAEGFLAKPLEPAELTAQIRAMTRVKAANRSQRTDKERLEALVVERTRELRKGEEALKESEGHLRSTLDGLSAHIAVLDDRGEIVLTNKSYRDFAERNGLAPGAVCEGNNYLTVCDTVSGEHSQEANPFAEGIREVLSGKCRSFELEYPCHSPDEKRWFIGRVTPIQGAETRRVVVAHENITERKRMEAEREKLEEQFRMSQKMEAIGSLAGGVAHDFNNLLSVILSYTGFAMKGVREGDPLKDDLLEVKNASERAAELTRQLLAFSRKQVLQPAMLDLNQIATGVEKMLRRIIGEDIDFVQVLSPDLGVVKADPGQIEQVLMNLVVNARDAMREGGKVTIETSNVEVDEEYAARHVAVKPGSYVQLAVSDTGCGMDEQTKARIFEPFFTTKEKGKGTGLGLSTVYGIVKQSGGNIWVYSEVGKGTTFKIYLPRDLSATTPTAIKPSALSKRSTGTETILVVEDEEALRKVALRILGASGYKVLTAADGDEALRVSAQHAGDIHLLLTDVVMPQMSGRVLAQELAKARPTVKVLYMSGYTDNAIVHHGVLDAGTHFLAKPFTSTDLTRKVREVLDGGSTNLADGQEQAVKDVAEVR